jgi:hypothetical protein
LILGNPSLSAYYQNKQVYDNAIKGFTAINPLAGNTLQKLAIQEQAMQEFALAQLEGRTLEAILGVPGAKGLYFTKQQLEGLSPTLTGSALLDKFAFPSDVQLAQGSDLGVEELDAAAEVPGGFSPLAIGLGVAALGLLLLVSKKRRK